MPDSELLHTRLADPQDDEIIQYHSVSGLAVVGLIVGVFAAAAMLTPAMWIVAWVGIVLNLLALWRVAREAPALIGRKAAWIGLTLSVFFAAAALSDFFVYRWLVVREAKQVAALWFEFLSVHEPQKAHQLTRHPTSRHPLDDKLWDSYFEGSEQRQELQNYVTRPEVRTLLALGKAARVRYYATGGQWEEGNRDSVGLVYAVTFDDPGPARGRKTFFVSMILQRHRLASQARAEWQITSTEGGVGPDGKKAEG